MAKLKRIKNIIAIFLFCFLILYTICQYLEHISIEEKYANPEANDYFYDVSIIKRNDIGLFSDDNKEYILNAKNNVFKKNILELISKYIDGSSINFKGKYREGIEDLIKNTNTIFLGDSNVKHFLYYDVLSPECYIEFEGKNIIEQAELVQDKLGKDISNIIIFNGYNIDAFNSSNEYIKAYKNLIKKIKNKIPNVNIYICSLLPATRKVIYEDLESPLPQKVYNGKSFDIALENEKNLGAVYVDTKWMLKDDIHKNDGVHMKKEFYETFIPYLTYFVNLNSQVSTDISEDSIEVVEIVETMDNNDKYILKRRENDAKVGENDIYYYDCDEQWDLFVKKYGEDALKVIKDSVFIGDSHLDRLLRPIVANITAICKPKRTLRQLEQEINQACVMDKKNIVIYTGNNDVNEEIKEYEYEYRYIHDLVSVSNVTDVFVCSFMVNSKSGLSGNKQDDVIKKICEEYDNFHYVDFRSVWDNSFVTNDRHLNFRFSFLALDKLIRKMNEEKGEKLSIDENIDLIAYNEKYINLDNSILSTQSNIEIAVGNNDSVETIKFGKYNGNDIEWIFMKSDKDGDIYMSKYLYFNMAYNSEQIPVTWENSTLRKYLNTDFYDNVFTKNEKESIVSSYVHKSDNEMTGQSGGNDTYDYIYIPSIEELKEYVGNLNNEDEINKKLATRCFDLKQNKDIYVNKNYEKWYYGNSPYWVRTPGLYNDDVAFVNFNGSISNNGIQISYDKNGVRLMIKIRRDA